MSCSETCCVSVRLLECSSLSRATSDSSRLISSSQQVNCRSTSSCSAGTSAACVRAVERGIASRKSPSEVRSDSRASANLSIRSVQCESDYLLLACNVTHLATALSTWYLMALSISPSELSISSENIFGKERVYKFPACSNHAHKKVGLG